MHRKDRDYTFGAADGETIDPAGYYVYAGQHGRLSGSSLGAADNGVGASDTVAAGKRASLLSTRRTAEVECLPTGTVVLVRCGGGDTSQLKLISGDKDNSDDSDSDSGSGSGTSGSRYSLPRVESMLMLAGVWHTGEVYKAVPVRNTGRYALTAGGGHEPAADITYRYDILMSDGARMPEVKREHIKTGTAAIAQRQL